MKSRDVPGLPVLVCSVALWLASFSLYSSPAAAADQAPPPLVLSAPLTHSDWVLKDNVPGLDAGLGGVRHMLDMCRAAGWTRIYWRCLDAGRSLYPSQLMDPMGPPAADSYFDPLPAEVGLLGAQKNEAILQKMRERYQYGTLDTLAEAVRYGHEIGLEIHAWLSLNEDDHAWGWPSRYTLAHPEHRWRRRDGEMFHSQLSFAWPQVREYKLAIVREILDRYDVDGLFIDWIRTGDVRDPQVDDQGHANFGYETILIEAYRKAHGVDPHTLPNTDPQWVRFRAEPQTEFMRSLRREVNRLKPGLPIAVLIQHPWGYRGNNPRYADNLRGLLLDVATWSREGLIDAAVPAGYYKDGGTPEQAWRHLREVLGDKVDIWQYGWVPGTPEAFEQEWQRAQKLPARQILFWEADYIDNSAQKAPLQELMRTRAAPPARRRK